MSRRMFVSYAREDLDVVTGPAADLQATGHRFRVGPVEHEGLVLPELGRWQRVE